MLTVAPPANSSLALYFGIACGVLFALLVVALFCLVAGRRRSNKKSMQPAVESEAQSMTEVSNASLYAAFPTEMISARASDHYAAFPSPDEIAAKEASQVAYSSLQEVEAGFENMNQITQDSHYLGFDQIRQK